MNANGSAVVQPAPEKPARWFRRIFRDPQRTRLDEEVQIAALRLENLRSAVPSDDDHLDIADQISQAIGAATRDLATLDIDGGYANLHLARELEFGLMSEAELDARTLELRAEAGANRFGKWRGVVVLALLDAAGGDGTPPERRRGLTGQAARIALSAAAEKNRTLTVLRRHQTILLLMALVLLAVAGGITFANTENFADLDNWWVAVVAVLLGALGGVTSALQRSTRSGLNSAGERFTSYVVSLSRPLMGAVAGFIAYIGQRVLIEQEGAAQVATVLVASFAAGFVERLLPVNPDDGAGAAPVPPPTLDEG